MAETPEHGTSHESPPDPADASAPASRRLIIPPAIRILLIVSLSLLALGIVADVVTGSSALCASCHEIKPRADSWARSAHASVPCVRCHQAPTEWYELPARLVDRGGLLARDIMAHASVEYEDPVDHARLTAEPVPDGVCLQCHNANREATSGFRILIDHVEHAERNGSCISCHVRTAHPVETRGGPLSLMAQCFTCHGTSEQPEASAECSVCHPEGYVLVPTSHTVPDWAPEHGRVALVDGDLCLMCHERSLCDGCHGVAMPHPEGWVESTTGHGGVALGDRTVCDKCHADEPTMCASCHHPAYDPARGPWLEQHADDANERGAAPCFDCHEHRDCVDCHVQTRPY